MNRLCRLLAACAAAAWLLSPAPVFARASTHDTNGVFRDSFLVLPEDLRDAARERKRVVLFFEAEGCQPCIKMAQTTFADKLIASKLKRGFAMYAVDLNGDRETVWIDDKPRSEKELARHLGVRGTPTILFLDEKGAVVQRLIGYQASREFAATLERGARQPPQTSSPPKPPR